MCICTPNHSGVLRPFQSGCWDGVRFPHSTEQPFGTPAGVLQFNSVLTLSTLRQRHVPQAEGSVR